MRSGFYVGLLLSLLLVNLAFSEDTSGKFGVSVEGGCYFPEMSQLDDNFIYGGSFSYHFYPWLFAELRAARYREHIPEFTKVEYRKTYYTYIYSGEKYPAGHSSSETQVDYDHIKTKIVPVDLNVGFSFLTEQKINPYISFGPTFFSARIDELPEMNDVAWGVNGGLGAEFFVAKLFDNRADLSLVTDLRYRWGKANFGLGYTSMSVSYFSESEDLKLKTNKYRTTELKDLSNDIDLGGFSAALGVKIYF
ncbi:MAG TPA: outer membrane beta-barrel protein [bacterium]|nr:outer membrane beta-barrel protein [bacterium]